MPPLNRTLSRPDRQRWRPFAALSGGQQALATLAHGQGGRQALHRTANVIGHDVSPRLAHVQPLIDLEACGDSVDLIAIFFIERAAAIIS